MIVKIRVAKEEGSQHLHRVSAKCEEAKTAFASGKLYESELIHGKEHANHEARRIQFMLAALGHTIELEAI